MRPTQRCLPPKGLRVWAGVAAAAVAAVLLASCASLGGQQAAAPAAAPAAEPAKPPAGSEEQKPSEFVFAVLATPVNLDPVRAYTSFEAQLYTAIYEGLVTYHPMTLAPVPGAARRWEVSNDGRLYRFYLREEGRFSNGDPVTAKVFRDSWLRLLDPKAGAEYSSFFDVIKGARDYRTGRSSDPQTVGIRVAGDYVLEVELERPAAHFLKLLCHMAFVPIHPFYHREAEWQSRESIVGNGPFYIYSKSDDEILLLRNNLYWDHASVKLDRIVVRFFSGAGAVSEGFNQGRIHWATSWDTSALQNPGKIVFNPLYATSFYFVRSDKKPWDDPRVRRALALLIPWEGVRSDQVFFPTARLVPQTPGYPDVERIEKTDKAEALRLLAEAGYPEGKGLPKPVLRVGAGGESERVAKLIAAAWKEAIGLEAEVSTIDYDDYFASLRGGDYTIGQMTWIGDFADPLTFLQMWTSESNLNDAHYRDPEYDRLIEEAIGLEGEERYKKFAEAESLILKTGVILPVSHQPSLNLIDLERIEGWFPNPLDIHPFKYIEFKGPQMLPNVVMR